MSDGERAIVTVEGLRSLLVVLERRGYRVVGPTRRAFTLSNKLVLPVLAAEHYVLVDGAAGPTDERGWETDLLGGLDLGQ